MVELVRESRLLWVIFIEHFDGLYFELNIYPKKKIAGNKVKTDLCGVFFVFDGVVVFKSNKIFIESLISPIICLVSLI